MYKKKVITEAKDQWKDEYKRIKQYIENHGYKVNLYNDYKYFLP